jgi:hypothetical protein
MNTIYFFKSESDERLDDIINDPTIKKQVKRLSRWSNHLMISFKADTTQNMNSYINLKYCDVLLSEDKVIVDFSPVAGTDYLPIRRR